MTLKEFIIFIGHEREEDVNEVIMETKDWHFKWSQDDIEIYQKEDSETHIDENGRKVIKYE
jgi:hypothetical protein